MLHAVKNSVNWWCLGNTEMKTHSPEFTVWISVSIFVALNIDVATRSTEKKITVGAPQADANLYLWNFNPVCAAYLSTCVTVTEGNVRCVCVYVCSCFRGAQCNHSSNLSARILCVGDIKVLISTVTQHQCHCEDTSNTSTPPKSTEPTVCICECMCMCVCEGGRL